MGCISLVTAVIEPVEMTIYTISGGFENLNHRKLFFLDSPLLLALILFSLFQYKYSINLHINCLPIRTSFVVRAREGGGLVPGAVEDHYF